jgi:hypothetical protein
MVAGSKLLLCSALLYFEALAKTSSIYKRQTLPLVGEGASQKNKTVTVKQ